MGFRKTVEPPLSTPKPETAPGLGWKPGNSGMGDAIP